LWQILICQLTLPQQLQQFLQQHPQAQNQRWIVAVSGGVDSVVLAHLCQAANISIAIAHCNFNLRGEESLRDKAFVTDLAAWLAVPLFVKEFDTQAYMTQTGKSVQVAARELRYHWFGEIAALENYKWIATAHHADDNAETVLMHLFRGSGIRGLRGMLPVQGPIIRPLLHAARETILAYAGEHSLHWVEDSSNETDKYTRNYLRHHLFPIIKQVIPHSQAGFERSVALLGETEQLYQEAIALHRKTLVEVKGAELHLPVLKLVKLPAAKTILYEIISGYGFLPSQLDDAFSLLQAASGKYVASPTHRLIRNRAWLILAPQQTAEAQHILIEKEQTEVVFREGALQLSWLHTGKTTLTDDANTAVLDAADIHFPLLLRPWRQGDYFYPLGMRKKKKLSRFFIDRKLSKTEKENIWVVESRRNILWIVGHRIDDRFKLEERTSRILKLHFTPIPA
jgi:tRNA(Ile)-lysidine synthase